MDKLSKKEAALYLGVNLKHVDNAITAGKFPEGEWLEGSKIYPKDALDDYKTNLKAKKDPYSFIQNALENKLKYSIKYNVLSTDILINGETLSDQMLAVLRVEIAKQTGKDFNKDKILDALIELAKNSYSFHPLLDKIKSFEWDKTERLRSWMIDYLGVEDIELARYMSELFPIAAIRRLKQPGCDYQLMPILEGSQGLGKSSIIKLLALDRSYYASDAPLHKDSKDIMEKCRGKWIIEISELASMRKSSVEILKRNVSEDTDEARLSYGRLRVDIPRQFILIGTTNAKRYLSDTSGNRRFVPLEMTKLVNLHEFQKIVPQLWAEALIKEKDYGLLQLPTDLWNENETRCDLRLTKDTWMDRINELINDKLDEPNSFIAQQSILSALYISPDKQNPWTGERVDNIMKQLGYKIIIHPENSLTCYAAKDTLELENEISLNLERFD